MGACVRPDPTPEPVFAPAPCQFEVPAGQSVECGYLTVPEDRGGPGESTLRLHVAKFKAMTDNPAPDPVVYLEGGPGGSALRAMPFGFRVLVEPYLEKRDFIIFDQRGTGFSQPALDCPENTELTYELLGQHLSFEDEAAMLIEAISRCRERLLEEGVNLSVYTSTESAADLRDLRLTLGYDRWNLLGISYGTKLALTAMRDSPEGIRSVILDSSYPLDVDAYTTFLSRADRAFRVLFDNCIAHPACNEAYPQLESTFFQLVEDLNQEPVTFPITHPITGETYDFLLDGDGLVEFLFRSLYRTSLLRFLPDIILFARDGNYNTLSSLQGSFLRELDLFSIGMNLSVQCGEEASFSSLDEVIDSAKGYPRLRQYFHTDQDPIFTICQEWGAKRADSIENKPVSSDISTLVLAGEYDPATPPEWGQLAAKNLSNSYTFEFPGIGHGASVADECPLSVALAFLDSPTSAPDAGCISKMLSPAFWSSR